MRQVRAAAAALVIAVAVALAACGGDNKGSAGPSGNQIQPTPVLASPASS
ncbi:MAG TPA: hypothetical protein VKA85_05705 [Candidatus Limnocylindrales bacterium]|nr:hypothetical protein [Candidatus Limnocylindrales bacterium]